MGLVPTEPWPMGAPMTEPGPWLSGLEQLERALYALARSCFDPPEPTMWVAAYTAAAHSE